MQQNGNMDDSWKLDLRNAILKAITGTADEKNSAYRKVGMYYECSAPASLFKYYNDSDYSLDALCSNRMWYSAPCNFNDPFDCDMLCDKNALFQSIWEYIAKMDPNARNVRKGSPVWKKVNAALNKEYSQFQKMLENSRQTTGIACLSELNDSLLMWAHYAGNHRGMCVEYNLLDINKKLGFSPVPVIYSPKREMFTIRSVEIDEGNCIEQTLMRITSKSKEWEYEQEWRIARDEKACGDRWNPVKKGALLDMIKPSSVTLGCQATEEFTEAVTEYCKTAQIDLYKMEKDPMNYGLNQVQVLSYKQEE